MRENTISLNSTIKNNIMNVSLWSSYMATVFWGMCHTFRNPQKMTANVGSGLNQALFNLDPKLNYRILIHDPKFYHILIKNTVFPRILLNYKAGRNMEAGTFDAYQITLTEHQLLNRPEQPCEEEEDYDFLECVKTSQARMVGCRPPWDIWSPPTIPLCETMDQFQHHEQLDTSYLHNSEQQLIVNKTGCQIPCKFKVLTVRFCVCAEYFPRNINSLDPVLEERRIQASKENTVTATSSSP